MKKVVIVGAGVIGLWCAVRLRQGGAQVTLLEAEREHPSVLGPMASAAAAGMLAPLDATPAPHESLAMQSLEMWRARQGGAEWADGVRFDGAVRISKSAEAASELEAAAQRLGRNAQPLTSSQVRKRLGIEVGAAHAHFIADEGFADPLRVLTGLAMQARALGALIDFETDVANVTSNSVLTQEGRVYDADAVILAPGAWATEKLIKAAPALRHVIGGKGHMASVVVERPFAPNLHTPGFYLTQRREDAVIGSTLELDRFDRVVEQAKVQALLDAAQTVLPGRVKPAGKAWAGIRPMSPDGWPMIGPTGEGIFVAAGHSRNGWLLAPITAEIITAHVLGGDIAPEWAALTPARFETP